jgi:uncharacterized protein YecT (DUF1311 family)
MKRIIALSTLCLFITSAAVYRAGQETKAQNPKQEVPEYRQEACWDKADTQADLRRCAAEDLIVADAKMNAVYEKVLAAYASQPKKQERIKEAQQAWLAYRALEGEALFPEGDWYNFGQFVRICRNDEMARMSMERAKELKVFLGPFDEGDVCSQKPPVEE